MGRNMYRDLPVSWLIFPAWLTEQWCAQIQHDSWTWLRGCWEWSRYFSCELSEDNGPSHCAGCHPVHPGPGQKKWQRKVEFAPCSSSASLCKERRLISSSSAPKLVPLFPPPAEPRAFGGFHRECGVSLVPPPWGMLTNRTGNCLTCIPHRATSALQALQLGNKYWPLPFLSF